MRKNARHPSSRMPGVLLVWLSVIVFILTAVDSLADSTARIVRQYALTSANDFPQRDPQDWRLLASNDGGKTWTTLDIRSGEIFSERHQRRVFSFNNNTAFNLYRLQIDRVRDPATADAVQLAQIEPMGAAENDFSPTPLFCDVITAQGENPPTEGADEAFDNQVETKWLDRADQHPDTRASWIQWQYLDHSQLVITNIFELRSLQGRADENYPVRISAVVIGESSGGNGLSLLDDSGQIVLNTGQTKLATGRRVLLEGSTQWTNDEVEVGQLKFTELEQPALDLPQVITIGQNISRTNPWPWVETEGQVQFVTTSGNRLVFDLVENGRSLSVHALRFDATQKALLPGARVRANGLGEGVLNENGDYVVGNLWIPDLTAITVLDAGNLVTNANGKTDQTIADATNGAVITKIDQVRHLTLPELARSPAVKVRGVLTEAFGICVQDETGGIELWTDQKPLPYGLGAYIEIEGTAIAAAGHGVAGYGPVIHADKITYLGKGELPNPIRPSWSLLASGQMDAQWVEVDAVVRATDGSHLLLAGEGGQIMATIRSAPVAEVNQLVDASVRVRGVSIAATDERGQLQRIQLLVPSLQFIEVRQAPNDIATLPVRNIDSLLQVRGPGEWTHRVKIQGILTGFGNNDYFIQDHSGAVMAMAKQDVVLSLPAGGWWSFWQSPKPATETLAKTELKVGDQVTVTGFPEMRNYAPVLTEAVLQKTGSAAAVTPVKATADGLAKGDLDSTLVTLDGLVLGSEVLEADYVLQIQSGQKIFQAFLPLRDKGDFDVESGSRVKITGVCQMEPPTHAELGKSPSAFSVLLRSPADVSVLERPPWLTLKMALLAAGALVVVLVGAFVWIRLLRRQVEVRTQQLKQEIAEHEKTEALLARKSEMLKREITEHEETEATLAEKSELLREEVRERTSIYAELEEKKISLEAEIEERKRIQMEVEAIHKQLLTTSRMAGMADVATNVLHNVGNVLNGVNVLAASIATNVKKSKVPGVSRLADLLAQHQADLPQFLTEDANGRHVLGHLERLGTHLTDEQSKLLERVKLLTENVQHIKEIVAVQQNYAKASGVWETVRLPEIMEDALRMCSEALERHQIKVVRDYAETPPVNLDRHKVLQILFNLLDNAKNACEQGVEFEKRVTVKIRRPDAVSAAIEVADNGMGISPENLAHIFTQGFSTRKEGHGFGLHSSILAAQDMGGTLTVHSDGTGKGAVFTLKIPLVIKDAGSHSQNGTRV